MSKRATPADPANPWDPAAWSQFPARAVKGDGDSDVVETVRAPTADEIRVLQAEIPEAAGRCLFVLEREAGAPNILPAGLPPDATSPEIQVILVNEGFAIAALSLIPGSFHDESVKEPSTVLLTTTGKLSLRTRYRWKKTPLWQFELPGGVVVLHSVAALQQTKAFGQASFQFRPDPGFRSSATPSRLQYSGDPARRPPLLLPTGRTNDVLLLGHAPRRPQTVWEASEAHLLLVELLPKFASTDYWLTGPKDGTMSSHGFVLATVFSDTNYMGALRDPSVFERPPWVAIADPSAVPEGAVLVALFTAPPEGPHVALRSAWKADGRALFESRIDFVILPSSTTPRGGQTAPSEGVRILHPLEALDGSELGAVAGYFTLGP